MSSEFQPVARLSDIDDGTMREVTRDGNKILLIRRGEIVTAIAANCPHAGGRLAEGLLSGDRIICPWHKAAFRITDGSCLEPPAVDTLPCYAVEIRDGDVLVAAAAPADIPVSEQHDKDRRRFVILGGGAGGAAAAQTLRQEGFGGRVMLIDHENSLPYDRTVLSKSALSGGDRSEKSPLQDEAFYQSQEIDRVTGEIEALDPTRQTVSVSGHPPITYDAAIIATGGAPIRPSLPGAELSNIFVLRSQNDAELIAEAAGRSRKAVIVGAGFIGMEAAASLRERGLEVTVVAPGSEPFEHQLGKTMGRFFRRLHEAKGVQFRLGRKVERFLGHGTVERVLLSDGETLDADLVILGLGVRPATDFVQNVPKREDGGLTLDAQLCVADNLYAVGDVAAFPLMGDGKLIRVEHWRVAQQQGRVAARNLLGAKTRYDVVPYFWTVHFGQQFDYVGHASGDQKLVVRGGLGESGFLAYYLNEHRVAAAIGLGRDRDIAAIIELMTHRRDWRIEEIHPNDSSPAEVLAQA